MSGPKKVATNLICPDMHCVTFIVSLSPCPDGGDLGPIFEFHISTFDNPDALVPSSHSFYAERISWLDTADSLPRYEGFSEDSPVLRHGPATDGLPGG